MPDVTTRVHEYGDDRMTGVRNIVDAKKSLSANMRLFAKYPYDYLSQPKIALKRVTRGVRNFVLATTNGGLNNGKKSVTVVKLKAGAITNKGDMLMVLAILQRLREWGPVTVCMDFGSIPRTTARELDISFCIPRIRKQRASILTKSKLLLKRTLKWGACWILSPFRIVSENSVDLLLDASGYAYSDYWGPSKIWKAIECYNSLRAATIVLMPQSLGPFLTTKADFRHLSSLADRIYARDRISLAYARSAISDVGKLKHAPDFTFDVETINPTGFNVSNEYICILPNHRIMDANPDSQRDYLRFLETCAIYAHHRGYEVVLVPHDSKHDKEVVDALTDNLAFPLVVYSSFDVRKIRWVIAKSKLVVSSRFHGLVNALTQSVPAIGLGWSHKFQCLMEEYDSERFLVNLSVSDRETRNLMDELLFEETRGKHVTKLINSRRIQKARSDEMWEEIISLLKDKVTAHNIE